MNTPTDSMQPQSGVEDMTAEGSRWESRLLALNALVELARQHAVGDEPSRQEAYSLERAIGAVRTASYAAPDPAGGETVQAAVRAFAETLATLDGGQEHRR